ncbi:MAG: MCE family protein, partial [Opitutales bacterium]|nr:MCE family protein [Opitutales bacterium]
MKNKISPAAIGMFVMAASIIAVAAVMVFGAAKFFSRTENFISFFSESVNGLDVGAPLKYKGVKIGKVEGIFISSSKNIKESSVSVVYSIDIDQLRRKTGTDFKDYSDWMDEQIAEGLRAKLNYQSIVTGMLYIELDFIADKGEKYDLKYGGTRFKEIPAAKSGLSELAKGFEKTMADVAKIDFAGIGQNVHSAIVKVNEKLDAIDAKAISDNAVSALKGVDDLVRNRDVAEAIKKLDVLLSDSDALVNDARAELKNFSSSGASLAARLDEVLRNVNSVVAPQSPLRYQIAVLVKT